MPVSKNQEEALDLNAASSQALDALGLEFVAPNLGALAGRTLVHLKTGSYIGAEIAALSLPERRAYAAYLNAFRLELTMVILWDLHRVVKGSTCSFQVTHAASDAEERLAGLLKRLPAA